MIPDIIERVLHLKFFLLSWYTILCDVIFLDTYIFRVMISLNIKNYDQTVTLRAFVGSSGKRFLFISFYPCLKQTVGGTDYLQYVTAFMILF